MANDTVGNATFFPACSEVLNRRLVPMHYRELTEMALQRLRVDRRTINLARQAEDVREKMLEAGRFGSGYLPAPHCLAYKTAWLPSPMPPLLNTMAPIRIAPNIAAAEQALYEGLMRNPHMLNKFDIPFDIRARKRARGLLIESHVKDWFQRRYWPFYRTPDNEGAWTVPCDHDFKLEVHGRTWKVDVQGPNPNDNTLTFAPGKQITDVHLIAAIHDDAVFLHGGGLRRHFVTGEIVDTDTARSILPLLVMLNCAKVGMNYFQLFTGRVTYA